ncbi:MAG: SUMF1/EgtB/PvdO family nonheme iron enzyme [Flavobacteriales bacterium]|nr:SUMF1/EgtB/PvdO family nonheme iron enzyme [Flavobacteriales bacterium]MCB9196379.1 SUMF1/EgtB/PvdO family nonheme iron enzyme [Flavobacteriales bacterium]MCB9198538.1 SUMF1/EgtB/PvdO family nonheme iron enzyme [Flavobacteriales bacterium]
MKIATIILLMIVGISIKGQRPQTVYSIVKDLHELSWYEEQFDLWKKEIDKNDQNANAWYNYYASSRAIRNLTSGEVNATYDSLCIEIIHQAYKAVPNSFEANHLMYKLSSQWGDPEYVKYLNKAYQINPNDDRTIVDFMTLYEVTREKDKYSEFSKKNFVSNELSAPLLNWAYNILSEVDQNAIILTAGDNDTYPIWTIQESKNYRKDVKNINTSLITIDNYRNRLFEELGIPKLDISFDQLKTMEEYDAALKKMKEHILKEYKRGPVYVTVNAIFQFEDWSDDFYLTGLTYKYSLTTFDNITLIKRNYEHRYLLDHLKEVFSYNISNSVANRMDALYLPSMVKLYQHYVESESKEKQTELLKLIISVSDRTGQQTEISELLNSHKVNQEDVRYITMLLNTKEIEKKMKLIKGNLFAGETEVTNIEYRMFLDNIKRSRNDELYNRCLYDSTKWVSAFNGEFIIPMRDNYHWHPAYDHYPIVNISHEAANEYCNWLTQQYNSQRKRKYTQVIFRLPTSSEWRSLAGGESKTTKTCFTNDKITNDKGCYLTNIKVDQGDYASDGGFFPVNAASYLPNDYGLYCTMGNVSEMTSTLGIAKGGSWWNSFEESTFDKEQKYDGPDPRIGFRIIMEVIQE